MYETKPEDYLPESLKEVIEVILNGTFGSVDELKGVVDSFRFNNDFYLLSYDFDSYIAAQTKVDETYRDKKKWNQMALKNSLFSGKFSSDRTI